MKNDVSANNNSHPERTFGKTKLLMMTIGTFVGSGLVSLTGAAAVATGYSVWLAYILAVVVGFLSALPFLCITSVMNFKGGSYTVACTFLGHNFGGAFAFLQVLNALILSILGSSFGAYIHGVFPSVNAMVAGVAVIVVFWAVHCLGIDLMANVQKYTTFILIGALAVFSVFAYTRLNPATLDFAGPEFFTNGSIGLFSAMAMLVFSSQSYDNNVLAFGRYTKNPRKNIPWGMFATFISLILIYGLVTIAEVGAVDLNALAGKPLTEVGRAILPTPLFIAFIILGPVMCLTTTVNGALASFTIGLAKASEDGWLPRGLATKGKRGTYWKITTVLTIVCLIPVIFQINIGKLSSITTLLGSVLHIPLLISFWRLPDMFPEEFAKSTLHLTKPVYRASIVIALAARLLITYCCIRNLNTVVAVGAIIAAVCCFAFSFLRYKTGKPKVEDAYFFD